MGGEGVPITNNRVQDPLSAIESANFAFNISEGMAFVKQSRVHPAILAERHPAIDPKQPVRFGTMFFVLVLVIVLEPAASSWICDPG